MKLTPQELILLINLIHKNNDELRDSKQEALPEDKSAFTRLIEDPYRQARITARAIADQLGIRQMADVRLDQNGNLQRDDNCM
jgi:hypothetical protein